jgi:hypothetical protein
MAVPFSPLSEFLESKDAQGELEKYLSTWGGNLFGNAMREYALKLDGTQAATGQDGARACVEMMFELTLSRQNAKKERQQQAKTGGDVPRGKQKRLHHGPPPPPKSRVDPPAPPSAPPAPVLPPKT